MLADLISADRRLSEQVTMLMAPWEWSVFNFMAHRAEPRHENILQRRLIHAQIADLQTTLAADFADQFFCRVGIVRQHIQTVAESLYVEKRLSISGEFVQHLFSVPQF